MTRFPAYRCEYSKNLKLNTTGFSRQFSDDLGTPTEVTKLVKMIEENIEEIDEGAVGDKTEVLFQDESQLMKPSPPSGKLYLNLKAPPQSEESVSQSSSGSSVDDDVRRSYAGVVLKKIPSYKDQELPLLVATNSDDSCRIYHSGNRHEHGSPGDT